MRKLEDRILKPKPIIWKEEGRYICSISKVLWGFKIRGVGYSFREAYAMWELACKLHNDRRPHER